MTQSLHDEAATRAAVDTAKDPCSRDLVVRPGELTPAELNDTDIDRLLVRATQAGLPLVPRPYHAIAERLGLSSETVMTTLRAMLERGAVRRIAAVPNHYALGYRANGMSVWNVDDDMIDTLGPRVGALAFVSHCYRRPRHPPHWPYNLFAMVHARSREAVQDKIECIAALLGPHALGRDVLYSTRILKKTGLRLA